jgi:predicted secreted protein
MRTSLGIQTLFLSSILTSGLAFAQSPLTPAQRPCGVGSVCQVTDNSAEAKVNLINLSVKVEQVIDNDTMEVRLYHEAEGATAGEIFALNSQALDKAFKRVDDIKGIKVSTGNRRSTPIYFHAPDKLPDPSSVLYQPQKTNSAPAEGSIIAWRERAEITLQSRDFKLLSTVLTDLAGDLQTESMVFKVSDQARKAQEGLMLERALTEFRDKATLTSAGFNASSYGLVNVSVGDVMPSYENQLGAMSAMTYKSSRSVSAPEVAGGESKFSLSVSGTIQLFGEGR